MPGPAKFGAFVIECPEPAALATFYSELSGWPVARDDGDWVTLRRDGGGGIDLCFQQAPGFQGPTWPDPASSMQYHIDFDVDDLDAGERRALALGATKFDHQPDPANFRVFSDPVGHVFCLCIVN
ncbi:MAG TPA: VOC family protein [Rugosimonospora sp.]|nr:VOC family protein [Rugosimonospora sp.]